MKVKGKSGVITTSLPMKTIRRVEQDLNVYIKEPANPVRSRGLTEQYGIYDENEVYAGDIHSENGPFLNAGELRKTILALDVWETSEPPRRGAGTGSLGSG